MKLKIALASKTKTFRNAIVMATTYVLAPNLYKQGYLVETRPMIEFLSNNYRTTLTGVEVGVENGDNALSMLANLRIEKLYLVDEYKDFAEGGKIREASRWLPIARKRLSKFDNVEFIVQSSSNASKSVPDNLDFVYIDANHAYDYVKEDIANWYPKVRNGGVIGGHDISWSGVYWAVTEFVKKNNLYLYTSAPCDWWVVKGKSCSSFDDARDVPKL